MAILYTSGTTGVSKGVCCPHAQYFWWGVNTARLLGLRGDDVLLTTLPLFHTNALNTFYAGSADGRRAGRASRASPPRASAASLARRRDGHLPARRDGADPARRGRPASDRAHRVRIALGPACPSASIREFRERFGVATARRLRLDRDEFRHWAARCRASAPARWARSCDGFEARVVDDADNRAARRRAGRARAARRRAVRLRDRLFRHAREDGRGVAQSVVPHRRSRRARRRRVFPLHRPHEGRDPPPRREHLVVRGRAGAAVASRRCRGGGVSRALRARRGRGHGGDRASRRRTRSPPPRCRNTARAACPPSPSRASSSS